MTFFTVYKTTNNLNGKVYIGQHKTRNLEDGYLGSGKNIRRAVAKYGAENFTKEILHIFETEAEMNAKEAELVTENFCANNSTYNIIEGGFGGWSYINANKLYVPNFGEKNGMYGKTHSEEARQKISLSKCGKKNEKLSANRKEYYSQNPMRSPTERQIARTKESNSKPVTDGIRTFASRKECAEFYGLNVDTVTRRIKSAKFPEWRFVNG